MRCHPQLGQFLGEEVAQVSVVAEHIVVELTEPLCPAVGKCSLCSHYSERIDIASLEDIDSAVDAIALVGVGNDDVSVLQSRDVKRLRRCHTCGTVLKELLT